MIDEMQETIDKQNQKIDEMQEEHAKVIDELQEMIKMQKLFDQKGNT